MKHGLPMREYLAWQALDRIWPIGWARDDWARARQTAATANAWGGEAAPHDFLPPEVVMSREMDDDDVRAAGRAMATEH